MKGLVPRVGTCFEGGTYWEVSVAGGTPQKGLQDSILPGTLLPNT